MRSLEEKIKKQPMSKSRARMDKHTRDGRWNILTEGLSGMRRLKDAQDTSALDTEEDKTRAIPARLARDGIHNLLTSILELLKSIKMLD